MVSLWLSLLFPDISKTDRICRKIWMESQSITTVSFASAHAKLNPATHFSSLEKTFAFPDLPESFPTQANVHGRLREGNKRRQLGEKIDAELPQTASLSLGFEQAEDVIDLDCKLRQRSLVSLCMCFFFEYSTLVFQFRWSPVSGFNIVRACSRIRIQSHSHVSLRSLHRDDPFLLCFRIVALSLSAGTRGPSKENPSKLNRRVEIAYLGP